MSKAQIESNNGLSRGYVKTAIVCAILGLAVISAMIYVNYQIVMTTRNSIVSLVDDDLDYVVKNAALVRFLGKISTEAGYLLNTFVRYETFDQARRSALHEQIRAINKTFLSEEAAEIREVIESYGQNVHMVMVECQELSVILAEIRALDRKIEQNLDSVSQKLHEEKISLMADGVDSELFRRVHEVLPVYYKHAQNLAFSLSRLNQLHVSTDLPGESVGDVVVKELDLFDSALVEMTISGKMFSGSGREIRRLLATYRKEFLRYFAILRQLPPHLAAMENSLATAIAVSGKIDTKISAKSEQVKMRIEHGMNSFIVLSSIIFVLFNVVSVALFFYILKVFKISHLNRSLQKALDEVKVLRGILPICAHCKNIRNDEGYWLRIETYLRDRSEVDFTHGICPSCLQKLYPDFSRENDKEQK